MPGPVTHLKAAYIYKNNLPFVIDEPLLYLGSICPDSVNINGHAPKSLRWPAHLRSADLDIWLENVKVFYRDNRSGYDPSYLAGYLLHIVTDIEWDRDFDRPLSEMMYRAGIPAERLKETRWRELYGYEQGQISLPWFKEALSKLSEAKPSDLGCLTAYEIGAFRDKIVSLELEKGRNPVFIDDGLMDRFFGSVKALADEIF